MTSFVYSPKYCDDEYEYRHVVCKDKHQYRRLLSEKECVDIGIQQSKGWVHYMIHYPEPHVLIFRRKLPTVNEPKI